MNEIYRYVNSIINDYIEKGVKLEDFINYLNTDEKNFDLIYQKLYKVLTMNNINFESDQLKDALITSIKDKINFLTDIKK